MNKQEKYNKCYLDMAEVVSRLSHGERAKVGCIIVSKDGQIISHGWNGMPTGFDNRCETAECSCTWKHGCQYKAEKIENPDIEFCIKASDGYPCDKLKLITKAEVLHAESNAIAKCAKFGNASTKDASLYVTMSPCLECSKLIIQSGISKVFYKEKYRNTEGIDLLKQVGIEVIQIE